MELIKNQELLDKIEQIIVMGSMFGYKIDKMTYVDEFLVSFNKNDKIIDLWYFDKTEVILINIKSKNSYELEDSHFYTKHSFDRAFKKLVKYIK